MFMCMENICICGVSNKYSILFYTNKFRTLPIEITKLVSVENAGTLPAEITKLVSMKNIRT